MVILRMEAADMADRADRAARIKAVLAATNGVFKGNWPVICFRTQPTNSDSRRLFTETLLRPRKMEPIRTNTALAMQPIE